MNRIKKLSCKGVPVKSAFVLNFYFTSASIKPARHQDLSLTYNLKAFCMKKLSRL